MSWEIGSHVERPPTALPSWATELLADLRIRTSGPVRVRLFTADPLPRTATATLDENGQLNQDQRPELALEDVAAVTVLSAHGLPRRQRRR